MKIKCYVLEIRRNNCQRRKTLWYQIPRHLNLDHFVSIFNFWRENFFTSVHFSLWQRWSLVHSWMQYCTARLVSQHFDLLLFSAIETYTESRISPAWLWLVKNYVTWYFLTNQDYQQATGAADLPPSSAVQCRPPGDFLKIIKKVDKWKYFECLRFFKVGITKALV